MISFVWDSNWESIPTDQIPRGDIRTVIGQTAQGTRERMEVEHEWGPNSSIDDGSHRLGGTGVMARGSTLPVTNLKTGELYLLDTLSGDTQVWLYGDVGTGLKWNLIGSIDHSNLTNRNIGDPHPIYLKRAGDDITPNELKMGGHLLKMLSGTPSVFGSMLGSRHRLNGHSRIGNLSAVQNSTLLSAKVGGGPYTFSGTVGPNTRVTILGNFYATFFPEVTVKVSGGAPNPSIFLLLLSDNLQLVNTTGSNVQWQARYYHAGSQ